MTKITNVVARDIRFPTSRGLDGSDAMNPDPDYSAAYVVLETDHPDGLAGHGMTFTIGRGNELCVRAVESLAPLVAGKTMEEFIADMAGFWRMITGDSQLRWVGPEKGVIHMATGAIVNAVWDLYAKLEGKPLWRLLAEMSPEQLVSCIDFRYISDAVTPDEAIALLEAHAGSKQERIAELEQSGFPSYTTSAGWLGYSDDKLRELCRQCQADGWSMFKIKVGRDLEDDIRRCRIIREEIGPETRLMMDANQVWEIDEAIDWMRALSVFRPWFIEEPINPDDILGHRRIAEALRPVKVATGEMCHNRVMFKQFLQSGAIGVCQIDSCRMGGVNEVLAVLLMAAKYGVPVCPHAGGVGLCEYVQHLAMFDYIAVSGTLEDRVCEYAAHLHEHFVNPIVMRNGRYMPPQAPGYSARMKDESLDRFEYPTGAEWADAGAG
ncbi:MAG: L-fuconate dehydratase [Planctomycetota bacterium]|nr:MAG: L-fuconate dehydratase [Planctomycetota bacterium]REK28074.1 MAG: L-fuconate dehydratase [Planctomycetota bacterium]REK37601.1 MAG: L-fuconate dehydratase [Planctomycetota bacterium]